MKLNEPHETCREIWKTENEAVYCLQPLRTRIPSLHMRKRLVPRHQSARGTSSIAHASSVDRVAKARTSGPSMVIG